MLIFYFLAWKKTPWFWYCLCFSLPFIFSLEFYWCCDYLVVTWALLVVGKGHKSDKASIRPWQIQSIFSVALILHGIQSLVVLKYFTLILGLCWLIALNFCFISMFPVPYIVLGNHLTLYVKFKSHLYSEEAWLL